MSNKVAKIIEEEFDSRVSMCVLSYLFQQVGMDKAKEISDEQIEGLEENAFMTKEFVQSLVRCARRIARECSFTDDIIPYIVDEYGHLSKSERAKVI